MVNSHKSGNIKMISEKEKERRQAVWMALSEFYLDTELSEGEIYRIAAIFSQSGYTIEELKEINYDEVAPVVSPNLMSTAGVWSGFDEEWLIERVIKRIKNGKPKSLFNKIYRRYIDQMTNRYWKQISERLK